MSCIAQLRSTHLTCNRKVDGVYGEYCGMHKSVYFEREMERVKQVSRDREMALRPHEREKSEEGESRFSLFSREIGEILKDGVFGATSATAEVVVPLMVNTPSDITQILADASRHSQQIQMLKRQIKQLQQVATEGIKAINRLQTQVDAQATTQTGTVAVFRPRQSIRSVCWITISNERHQKVLGDNREKSQVALEKARQRLLLA